MALLVAWFGFTTLTAGKSHSRQFCSSFPPYLRSISILAYTHFLPAIAWDGFASFLPWHIFRGPSPIQYSSTFLLALRNHYQSIGLEIPVGFDTIFVRIRPAVRECYRGLKFGIIFARSARHPSPPHLPPPRKLEIAYKAESRSLCVKSRFES